MTGSLTTRRRDDGVLVVSLDVASEKLNVLSLGLLDEFETVFSQIEKDITRQTFSVLTAHCSS